MFRFIAGAKELIRSGYTDHPVSYFMDFLFFSVNKLVPVHRIGKFKAEELKNFLGADPTIVEIGAFNGLDTRRFARLFPTGKIYAFEPVSALFAVAFQRLKFFKNVVLYPFACGNVFELNHINVSSGSSKGSSSILDPSNVAKYYRNIHFSKADRNLITTLKLDDWANAEGVKKVELLWLDTQGYEGLVLDGAASWALNVEAVYCEVNYEQIYIGSTLFSNLTKKLNKMGFVLIKQWDNWPQGDALFFNTKFDLSIKNQWVNSVE
jgi:FkbM family methyltransferase